MGYKGHKPGLKRFLKSFVFAVQGVNNAWKHEMNIRFHVLVAILISFLGLILRVTTTEWLILLLTIFAMISLELVNTAIERTVDLVTDDFKPLAKQAKDVAAGAVLIFSIGSIIIGVIIFLPKIIRFLN
ncbi:diacylglycerol kinase family protein [Rossellomorea sp. BNER]|uniref:diacylglycerol kinase family protein n=1 Tax=Rossellomorea sp. BNER TaxID=2962031 RepID=UPI003AF234A2|nr:diacylglycerol kinase family protein [Rossellomorea sp. BNER]